MNLFCTPGRHAGPETNLVGPPRERIMPEGWALTRASLIDGPGSGWIADPTSACSIVHCAEHTP